ncbi:D-arabinono-1,4-lactone oxidase [Streptomyces malaysiensis]|uniref:D-arabinono-1,4-lactone oxidase n=1 Tax=Streptomyces malaysiensis TaxID=92644 RepID=UPI002B2B4636|nr:FAD-binding protein [Streptomyces malaysiensis]
MTETTPSQTTSPPVEFVARQHWNNWSGQATANPAFTVYPASEQEVEEAVRFALTHQLPVRPVGSGHSWTPLCSTPGIMIDLRNLKGVRIVDRERKRVAVKAGTTIFELGEALWDEGFSLKNQGDIDVQTIAGALSTGTHGSGARLGVLASSVYAVRLVDGRGNLVEITEEQPEHLKAAQVSLGLLGVITEVELEVVDRYYLEEEVTYPTWQDLLDGWDSDVADNHHSSWFWFPRNDSPERWGIPVPDEEPMADRAHLRRINVAEGPARQVDSERRVDRNYLIYRGEFDGPYYEMELFVPAARAREAVTRIRTLLQETLTHEKYPVQPRWVQADEIYLSPAYGTDSVGISIGGDSSTEYEAFFRKVDHLLSDLGARMHWGKIHFLDRQRVAALYPEFETFQRVRRNFDPNGIFLNAYGRDIFG